MAASSRSKTVNKLLSDKAAIRNYEDVFTREDVHPGSIIPSGNELRHNLTANRDPLPEDDFSLGYREGSSWFNQFTKDSFVCLESSIHKTIWVKVRTNLDNVYSKVSALLPVREDEEEFYIEVQVSKAELEIKKVFSVYFLDNVRVLQGWAIDGARIYFRKNIETNFMLGQFAIVSYSEGTKLGDFSNVEYIP